MPPRILAMMVTDTACLCMVEENGEVALTGVMRCAKAGTVETTEDLEFFLP